MQTLGQMRSDVVHQALANCSRALEIYQGDANGDANMWNDSGFAYWWLGDTKRATQDFMQALSVDPGNVLAKGNLRSLESDVRGKRILRFLAFLLLGGI